MDWRNWSCSDDYWWKLLSGLGKIHNSIYVLPLFTMEKVKNIFNKMLKLPLTKSLGTKFPLYEEHWVLKCPRSLLKLVNCLPINGNYFYTIIMVYMWIILFFLESSIFILLLRWHTNFYSVVNPMTLKWKIYFESARWWSSFHQLLINAFSMTPCKWNNDIERTS